MNIFVMRHGTTVWNEQNRSQGRSQNRLSKNGIELTKSVAKKIKDYKIDIIYASPLMRTMQTANIVNQNLNVKIIKSDLIIEIDQGVFTGRFYKDLTPEELRLKMLKPPELKMETYAQVYERAKKFVNEVLRKETHENILVITHDNVCSLLQCIFNNVEPDYTNFKQLNNFDNCTIKEFKI